jgi:hypothetical protein
VRLTHKAVLPPHRCAALPFIGNSNAAGWIDTGSHLEQERVYLSFQAVAEMARMIGWVAPSQRHDLEAQVASLRARVTELEAEVGEADKFAEAAEYTLAHFGQRVQRKPGRKERVA